MQLFSSFLWAGFECTYAKAEQNRRFDLLSASKHDLYCQKDYLMIKKEGIRTVREGLSWNAVDKGNGEYDFSRFEPMMKIAQEEGIQQIWDLNHFDFADYLDPFTDTFIKQYGEYAKRCIECIRKYNPQGTIYIAPMNEPSFFAWMCDNAVWAPYGKGRGTEFKKQLIRAAICAMDAIWSVDKDVQFIHIDPYMHHEPHDKYNENDKDQARRFNQNIVFHAWDMMYGKRDPELGGDPKYFNLIGINYYLHNQQTVQVKKGKPVYTVLSLKDKRRLSFSNILREVYDRYQVPIVVTETGSHGDNRLKWWKHMLDEIDQALKDKLPLYGVCSYPTLDIPEGAGFLFLQSGLWDFDQSDPTWQRIPHKPTLELIASYLEKWRKN